MALGPVGTRLAGLLRRRRAKPLSRLLPLTTPQSVMIDPTNACNFRCSFCPTGNPYVLRSAKRPTGFMEMDLFERIVDGLEGFPEKVNLLTLYKDGEPLLNRNLGRMISYSKKKAVALAVQTTTNASLLSREMSVKMIESGLDRIRISIKHVSDSGYLNLTKTFGDYDLIREHVRILYEEKSKRRSRLHVHAKILDTGLNEEEKEKFRRDFSGISDSIHIDTIMGWSDSGIHDFTLGLKPVTSVDGTAPLKPGRVVCPEPFRTMAVNYNGLVSVCCVDWSMGAITGNAEETDLPAIWEGESLRRFRILHLQGKRGEIKVCADCQYLAGLPEENDLDDHAEGLLAKFSHETD